MYRRHLKRAFDLAAASLVLLVMLPLMALVAIAVRLRLGAPIFFVQTRPGLNGRLFRIVKFRTMHDARDLHGRLAPDAERLGRFGTLLRSTSLDELPQLWNVVKGDMSLIGPRPLLPEYLDRYTPTQARRHDVRPGITGLAQVKGRNAVTWEDRLALDVDYVDSCSLRTDAVILFLTVGQVVSRKGVSQAGHATMEPFMGSALR